jgi:hypothetical protein
LKAAAANDKLTFWVVHIFDGNGKSSLEGNFVLKDGGILMGSELPFAISFPLEGESFVAKLFDTILQTQFVIVNSRKVFTVELPAVDELFN